jgi:hypothetical protein
MWGFRYKVSADPLPSIETFGIRGPGEPDPRAGLRGPLATEMRLRVVRGRFRSTKTKG